MLMGFPGGSIVKSPPANAGDMGLEDAVEKGMETLSSFLDWEILWTEEPGRLHIVHGVAKEWDTN